MAQQDFARLALIVEETYQVNMTSISMATNSGQQRVDLLNEGLAGFTPGSGDITISGGYAIPVGGQEFDFQEVCAEGSYITMQVPVGDKDYVGVGKVTENEIGQSVNASTEATFTWVGELAAMQG